MKKGIMRRLALTLVLTVFAGIAIANSQDRDFEAIKNYHAVSEILASAGGMDLEEYQNIKAHGFQHVINLVPGNQIKARKYVESLSMSYEQIPVAWDNPTFSDFEAFVELMDSYGDDKVFVHCQLNWRASSFVYLYRVTQLGVSIEEALEDLLTIWTPKDHWQEYIDTTSAAYKN